MDGIDPETRDAIKAHALQHCQYPINRENILMACGGMEDLPETDRELLKQVLPDGEFHDPDELLEALEI